MIHRSLLIISLFISLGCLFAQDSQTEIFVEANRAYKQENYQEAIKLYATVAQQEFISDELFYNLGTSHLKVNNISEAVLNLNRCLKLSPNHKQALNNLTIARGLVSTEISAIPDFFLSRYWRIFFQVFTSTVWALFGMFIACGFAIAFYFWLISEHRHIKKRAFFIGLFSLVLFVIVGCAGLSKVKQETSTEMAVLMNDAQLYSGADDRSDILLELSPGVELEITDVIGEYYKVILMDKEVGWIKKMAVELI